jgi:multisubunit Na+/H+ antiporter MnhC subunit
MFNRSDLKALIATVIIIGLGYAAMHLFIFLDEYFKLTNY